MSDETEIVNKKTSWWSKQSTGAKAAIGIVGICCLGLILVLGLSAMASPDKTATTPSQSTATPQSAPQSTSTSSSSSSPSTTTASAADQNYIEVSYPGGSWDGSITIQSGSNEDEVNFDGSGTKKFDLTPYKGKDVYVMAQKEDGSSGKLSAVIVRDGKTKLTKSTTEGYGIVNGWVFSWS